MDDKIISTLKLKRASNSLKSKFISTKGGTMEGNFNIDALYFKINTASGYKQAFGTIRGGLLALGSDELSAALYGYDSNQKPQWVYKEGSNYVFKDLALKDDVPQIKEVKKAIVPQNMSENTVSVPLTGVTDYTKLRIVYVNVAVLSNNMMTYQQLNVLNYNVGAGNVNVTFMPNSTSKTFTVMVGYMILK